MNAGGPLTEFNQIYEEYADAIFRHLYYRLQDRDRALELVQDVFTRLWQYLESGKAVEHPKAFLYRSASNAFVNEIRGGRRTVSLESMTETGFDIKYEKGDVEELAIQQEIVKKLNIIDKGHRDVLVMRYMEGMQVKEIATLLGKSENNVSVRIKRGLEKLKKIYEQPG